MCDPNGHTTICRNFPIASRIMEDKSMSENSLPWVTRDCSFLEEVGNSWAELLSGPSVDGKAARYQGSSPDRPEQLASHNRPGQPCRFQFPETLSSIYPSEDKISEGFGKTDPIISRKLKCRRNTVTGLFSVCSVHRCAYTASEICSANHLPGSSLLDNKSDV
jgi:hypothetical protein